MMRAYQHNQYFYPENFSNAYDNSGWNYTLFGYEDYSNPATNFWPEYGNNYPSSGSYLQRTNSFTKASSTTPLASTNNYYQPKQGRLSGSSMLKAKESGRVFYPTKVHHSRHNSHDDPLKGQRDALSPLNRSHDSTCDSSSGYTDSSSKDGSGSKLTLTKASSAKTKEIIPIRLSFDDEPATVTPTLVVEVVSSSENVEYELDQNDVRKVFEKFGPVTSVEIHEKSNKAVVVMEDAQHGYQAEKYLNFYQLPGTNAYLTVKWQFGDYECLQRATKLQKGTTNQNTDKFSQNQTKINKNYQVKDAQIHESVNEVKRDLGVSDTSAQCQQEVEQADDSSPLGLSKECTSVSKFTCKYEIPLRNLPGFSVARKIIGHRGKNMKTILERLKDSHFSGPIQDVIKLRLRGQGSGFKEGPSNCESPEPLHLCVSSKYFDKYNEACKLVEKLLKDVYQEYNNYCRWKGRPVHNYKIAKMENSPASYLSGCSTKAQQ